MTLISRFPNIEKHGVCLIYPNWPLKQCASKNLTKNLSVQMEKSYSFDVKDTRQFHYSELNTIVTVQSHEVWNVNIYLAQRTEHSPLVTETSWLSGAYPEIGKVLFWSVNLRQQLMVKKWVHSVNSIVPVQTSICWVFQNTNIKKSVWKLLICLAWINSKCRIRRLSWKCGWQR